MNISASDLANGTYGIMRTGVTCQGNLPSQSLVVPSQVIPSATMTDEIRSGLIGNVP